MSHVNAMIAERVENGFHHFFVRAGSASPGANGLLDLFIHDSHRILHLLQNKLRISRTSAAVGTGVPRPTNVSASSEHSCKHESHLSGLDDLVRGSVVESQHRLVFFALSGFSLLLLLKFWEIH